MQVYIHKNAEETALALATCIAKEAEKSQRLFAMAISGGQTPEILFSVLAQHFIKKIRWENVHIFWVDERCVPPDDNQSNYKNAYIHWLSKISIPKENIHRIRGEDNPTDEAIRYGQEIKKVCNSASGYPVFDFILLGLGVDGHTASIFPGQEYLLTAKSICKTSVHPASAQKRISLSGKVINNALRVAFLVTGQEKKEIVKRVIYDNDPTLPASFVQPKKGKVYWFLDDYAAELIKGDFYKLIH